MRAPSRRGKRLPLQICAALASIALCAIGPRTGAGRLGSFRLEIPDARYFSGSRITIGARGVDGPFSLSVIGPGSVTGTTFTAPQVTAPTQVTLVAAAAGAVAVRTLQIVPPPAPRRRLIAVASYQCGIALHDSQTFAFLGCVAIGGAPGDVAFTNDGSLVAPQTDGQTLTRITRSPWKLTSLAGVVYGNEVAIDRRTQNIFVSNRDVGGKGAVTRVTPLGTLSRVITGETAEGLALDAAHQLLYVGNVNDQTIAEIDARTMQLLGKLQSVPRTFGLAVDVRAHRLYAVANASRSMIAGGGYVAAIDVASNTQRVIARSGRLVFPLGIALDARTKRLFVTDEAANVVYVLDSQTLRMLRAPLRSCETPWKPRIAGGRLFIPCSGSAQVDAFDLSTLKRVRGAPFRTGGNPLAVDAWPS